MLETAEADIEFDDGDFVVSRAMRAEHRLTVVGVCLFGSASLPRCQWGISRGGNGFLTIGCKS
jgi:hypothetical protein